MKKTHFLSLLIIAVLFIFNACSQDDTIYNLKDDAITSEEYSEKGIINIIYKGIHYSSECIISDTTIIYSNQSMIELAQKLESLPNVASFIHDDGSIEYFDSPEELRNKLDINKLENPNLQDNISRSVPVSCTLSIYEHSDYGGESITFTVNGTNQILVNNLKNFTLSPIGAVYNFNDKISSFKLNLANGGQLAIVTFYRDSDYQGNSIWFKVNRLLREHYVLNFKTVPLYPGSSKNFNDRISSIKLESHSI